MSRADRKRRRQLARRRRTAAFFVLVAAAAVVAVGWSLHASTGEGQEAGTPLDPATFATGSCLAYQPTAGNRHLTVFLDAGHGGIDPGGVGTTQSGATIDEATLNLPVELEVSNLLRAKGFRVVVSRTTDSTVLRLDPADESGGELTLLGAHDDVAARDVCANLAHADVLVGIYLDAGSPSDGGSLTAYDSDRPFATSNLRLATLLQTDVVAEMNAQGWGIPDDGVQTDDELGSYVAGSSGSVLAAEAAAYNHLMLIGPAASGYFSTPSQMPGAVIEPLYLTDPFEGSIADSPTGQQVIARGIATAVEQYFSPTPTPTTG